MKILVNDKEMNVLVKVPKDRKCAASIDIVDTLARLSFGDLDTPEVDVEVDFTLEQLTELMQVVALGYHKLEAEIAEHTARLLKETEKAERAEARKRQRQIAHYGSC